MPVVRYTLKCRNTQVSPENYQLVGFTMNNGKTNAINAARCLAYISTVGFITTAQGTSVESCNVRVAAAAGGFDIPFPRSEYDAAIASLNAAGAFPRVAMDYGTEIGFETSVLAPLGTSVSVSEITATVGPTGRGRHFLPYVGAASVFTNGRLQAAAAALIRLKYIACFFDPTVLENPMITVVTPQNLTAPKLITEVKAQQIFSNLESRRR